MVPKWAAKLLETTLLQMRLHSKFEDKRHPDIDEEIVLHYSIDLKRLDSNFEIY